MAILLQSLAAGQAALLGASSGNHDLTVAGVRVRGRRWKVVNKAALCKLVRADSALALLEVSVLPALSNNPVSGVWLDELYRLTDKLEAFGNAVGGNFKEQAVGLVKRARYLGSDINHGRRSVGARNHRVLNVINLVAAFRERDVTLNLG